MSIVKELNSAFLDYFFVEDGHKYIHIPTGIELTSVTTLLKKKMPKFDERYWLAYKTLQRNGYDIRRIDDTCFEVDGETFRPGFDDINQYDLEFTVDDLKTEWNIKGKVGTSRGTLIHNYMENLWHRKELKSEIPYIVNSLSAIEAIKFIRSIEISQDLCKQIYNQLKETHVLVNTEFVVGDVQLGYAGTFDLLLYNKETGEYEIWDYKTDKQMNRSTRELIAGFMIPASTVNKYSLQLGLYKYMIERNTDIKISKCNIIHFNYKKNVAEIIETNDYSEAIVNFFETNNKWQQ